MIAYMAVIVFAVSASVCSAAPRWLVLWFQYRVILVEAAFTALAWAVFSGSTAFKATMLIAACMAWVTVLKVINLAYKEDHGSHTAYERFLMMDNGKGKVPIFVKFFTKNSTPLRTDFVFDKKAAGWWGLKYFAWSMAFDDGKRDFFQSRPPSGKPSFWSRFKTPHKRAEAKVNAEESLQQWKLRKAAEAILSRRELELEELKAGPMNLEHQVRAGKLARDILKLREELAA